jgi:hypothetical protein
VVREFAILGYTTGQSTPNVTEEETSGRWIKCIIRTRCVVVSFVFLESGARITSQKSDLLTEVFLFFNIIYRYMSKTRKWSLSIRFRHKRKLHVFFLHKYHVPQPPQAPSLLPPNYYLAGGIICKPE